MTIREEIAFLFVVATTVDHSFHLSAPISRVAAAMGFTAASARPWRLEVPSDFMGNF
jgi:hypothetical protein